MRIGIVGCGSVAHVHAVFIKKIWRTNSEFTLVLCDNKLEKAQQFAREFTGEVYDNYDQMLENGKLDFLHICTPHYLHVTMAVKALKKNINVLMEKPPAINRKQLAELQKVEECSEARLGICFQNRYNDTTILMKDEIESKRYGKVIGARAYVTWNRPAQYYTESDWRGYLKTEGGGVLINQTIHTLDLLNYFLGQPKKVDASIHNHHLKGIIEVEDTVEALIYYKNGVASFYATSGYVDDLPVFIEVALEYATLRIEGNTFSIIQNGKVIKTVETAVEYQNNSEYHFTKGYWGYSHGELIQDFYTKIKKQQDFPVTLGSCIDTMRLILDIYQK